MAADVLESEGDDIVGEIVWAGMSGADIAGYDPIGVTAPKWGKLMFTEGPPTSRAQLWWALAVGELVKRVSGTGTSNLTHLFQHCWAVIRGPHREGASQVVHWRACACVCTALLHHGGAGSRETMQDVVLFLRDIALSEGEKGRAVAGEGDALRDAAVWALGMAWPESAELIILSMVRSAASQPRHSLC